MKKYILLLLVIGLVSIGSTTPSFMAVESVCDVESIPQNSERYVSGIVVYKTRICPINGVIIFTEWYRDNTPISRNITLEESIRYVEYLVGINKQNALVRLNSDVLIGDKWVEILKNWQAEGDNIYKNWPEMTTSQKDLAMREMIFRMSLTWGGLGDLLQVLDLGRK